MSFCGSMIKELVNRCRLIAGERNRERIVTASAFIALITEQLGQVAHVYWDEGGREALAKNPHHICDVIVQCVCLLDWLGLTLDDIEKALRESLIKLEKAIVRSST